MDQRSQPVGGGVAADLLEAEAWEGCHEAYQAYLLASRVHSRCLRDALEGRVAVGSVGVAEAGTLARELLIEWLSKCEAVSQELAWGPVTTRGRASGQAGRPSLRSRSPAAPPR